jgi:hypothetical protein
MESGGSAMQLGRSTSCTNISVPINEDDVVHLALGRFGLSTRSTRPEPSSRHGHDMVSFNRVERRYNFCHINVLYDLKHMLHEVSG